MKTEVHTSVDKMKLLPPGAHESLKLSASLFELQCMKRVLYILYKE